MAVPSKPPRDVISFHRLIARHNIFERLPYDMSIMRQSCRKWRTIVKGKIRLVLSIVKRFFENAFLLPKRENPLFALWNRFLLIWFKHTLKSMVKWERRNHTRFLLKNPNFLCGPSCGPLIGCRKILCNQIKRYRGQNTERPMSGCYGNCITKISKSLHS